MTGRAADYLQIAARARLGTGRDRSANS